MLVSVLALSVNVSVDVSNRPRSSEEPERKEL